jgi:uncharacterized protein (TIGR02147 family)
LNIFNYLNYRDYLRDCFAERKRSDPEFSHRYFNRRLGLTSPNFMLMVMQGRRNISPTVAFKISALLKHTEKETEYFENLVGLQQAKTHNEKDRFFNRLLALRRHTKSKKLEEWQYEYYSHWYNLVVRELAAYPEFGGDFRWLAKNVRPPITLRRARKSVDLLLTLGLLEKRGCGYQAASPVLSTGPEVRSLAVAKFNRRMAELAISAYDGLPRTEREFSGCTVNIPEKRLPEISRAIAECRAKIMSIAGEEVPPDRVFHVNFHVFPVSAKIKRNN